MTELAIHPGLVLMGGALLLPWLRGRLRAAAILLLPLLVLALVWQVADGAVWQLTFLEHTLTPLRGDKLSRLFALGQPSRLEVPAAFLYAGAAIGVALAGDLVSVFVFWELMAVGSTLVLWSHGGADAYRAARRYLMIHLLGGTLLFAGVTGHVTATGSVGFGPIALDSPAQWLILAGFLINAGAPPLSAWLPDAYPEASWSGTVFLSAFTTKAAVYVLIRSFAGVELLIWVGLFMVFYGIVYALLENDIRRILAYSIVSQVGFMIVGVGIGTEMAINGAAAHAFAHILYKALLLMSAGSVIYMTGRRKCSELGGLFHSMPVTTICGIVGALAISAFPLTSGFVSKAMISQSAADQHLQVVWMLLAAASAGTFLYAGIKFTWFVFFQTDSGLRPSDPPASMRWGMVLFSFLCIAVGVWAEPLYALLPYPVDFVPYTAAHVLTQLQLLLFSGLAFFVMLPFLKRTLTITLDADWLWRRLLPGIAMRFDRLGDAATGGLRDATHRVRVGLRAAIVRVQGPTSHFGRTWPIGSMALWMLVMLLGYLVLYYL